MPINLKEKYSRVIAQRDERRELVLGPLRKLAASLAEATGLEVGQIAWISGDRCWPMERAICWTPPEGFCAVTVGFRINSDDDPIAVPLRFDLTSNDELRCFVANEEVQGGMPAVTDRISKVASKAIEESYGR